MADSSQGQSSLRWSLQLGALGGTSELLDDYSGNTERFWTSPLLTHLSLS